LGYRADVDGLRGIAILLVLLFHAGVPRIRGGYSGVDIFFVISGYLIGFQVARELRDGRFALVPFYEKRVRRILPALFAVIAFTLLAGWVLLDARELRVLGEQSGPAAVSLSNVYYWATTSYFSPNSHLQPLLMTWSLGIEVQFYLLLPLLAMAVHRWSKQAFPLVLLVTLVASLGYTMLGQHRGWPGTFYLLGGRWWELATGAVLGAAEARKTVGGSYVRGWRAELCGLVGLAGLVASAFLPAPSARFLVPPTLISVAAGVLLCLSASSWVNRRLLASGTMSAFGRRSYSVYLWHWPLLSLAYVCGAGYLAPWGRATVLVATLLVAEVSYRWVELPFRRPRSRPVAMAAIAVAGAAVLVVSGVFVVTRGVPSRNAKAAAIEVSIRHGGVGTRCLVEGGVGNASVPEACLPASATVALLGDSHAAAIAPGLVAVAPESALLMKASCPPLIGVTIRDSGPDVCSAFEDEAVMQVKADPSIRTVLIAGYWLNPVYDPTHVIRYVRSDNFNAVTSDEESWANLRQGLLAVCLPLRAAGKSVVLLEDVPFLQYDPHLLAVGGTIPLRASLGRWASGALSGAENEPHPRTSAETRVRSLLEDVATSTGSRVVSLYDPLCDGTSCRVLDGGMPLFEDRQHLTPLGAERAVGPSGIRTVIASAKVIGGAEGVVVQPQ
jgi:peptidoglycan/LPS O-acetylase OafA/YrhL